MCIIIIHNIEFEYHKSIITTYFNTVGNAVVLVMFTTSVSWTLLASAR